MHIDEVHARSAPDEELRTFWELERACYAETNPGEPPRTAAEVAAFLRFQPTTHTSCHWRAPGGVASLYVHGPTAAFARILVDPDCRRRGVGTALAAAVVQRSRELGVRMLHGHHVNAA